MIPISRLELYNLQKANNLKFERVNGLYELVSGEINEAGPFEVRALEMLLLQYNEGVDNA